MTNLTPEQLDIINAAATTNDNLVVDAKAGSGKTFTLLEVLKVLRGTSCLHAFNKSIAQELTQRASRLLSFEQSLQVSISTVHSHGLSAFRRSGQRPNTQSGKLSFMLGDMLETFPDGDDIHRNKSKIRNLVSYAKSAGFGLTSSHENFPAIEDEDAWLTLIEHYRVDEELIGETTTDDLIELSIRLLKASNARLSMIDFDDMIYLPLLHGFAVPTYDNVLIDEAQDINATRRELAFRSLNPDGRLIAVGDPHQAIYGFTGADPRSLSRITERAGAKVYPLSICWRCDALIIKEAQHEVPTIQARPDASDGQVLTIDFAEDNFLDLPEGGDAILCRLNKPNVAAALGLLRRGKRPRIEGRDLGKRLLDHVQRAEDRYAFLPLVDLLPSLDLYRERETTKLLAKNRESAAALLEDEVDAVTLLIERCIDEAGNRADIKHLEGLVTRLFGDDVSSKDVVTLSSVHKAKGREWPRVFILGYKDYMPFHLAESPWEIEQEHNLIYVAKTRAENTLVYVNGARSAIDNGVHREKPKAKEPQA